MSVWNIWQHPTYSSNVRDFCCSIPLKLDFVLMIAITQLLQKKRKLVICWLLSGRLYFGQLFASLSVAASIAPSLLWEAWVADRVLVAWGLCSTRSPAKFPLVSSFSPQAGHSGKAAKFRCFGWRPRQMSTIGETPAAVLPSAPVEAWWLQWTGAVVVGVVDTNCC